MNKSYSQILDSAAGLYIPVDLDLFPRVAGRLNQKKSLMQTFRARPSLVILLAILALLLLSGAAYAISKLTGYIPGVGLIDQSVPLRVLTEPVTVTRSGITLIVEQAILSADKTVVIVKTEGIPLAAYPKNEGDAGCPGRVDLKLPDGTFLEGGHMNGDNWSSFRSILEYGPVPANVSEASLQVACIGGTIAGTLPGNWQIPIRFAPAPPDMTIVPVIDVSTSAIPPEATAEPAPAHLEKALQIGDQYILMGKWDAQVPKGFIELAFPELTDANGQQIVTTMPNIPGLPAYDWSVQFKGAGIAYPVTLSFTGRIFSAVPNATAEFVFDAGEIPQPGQQWVFNKVFDMAGHIVQLVSITATSSHGYMPGGNLNGYSFEFQTDPDVKGLSVTLQGHEAVGGGGGGMEGHLEQSVDFTQLPTGKIRVILSDLTIYGNTQTWKIQWRPETLPVPETASSPENPSSAVCITSDNVDQLPSPLADLQGKVVLYRQIEKQQSWGIVLSNLDGSQQQVLVPDGNWPALSPDGNRLIYSGTDDALHLIELTSSSQISLGGTNAYDPVWSPDGTQIAYIDNLTVDVIGADGSNPRTLTKPDHYSMVGWSPDGAKLYFTLLGADGFSLNSVDVATDEIQSLFTLEDSSHKAPFATISPDSKWIAYRGSDNSTLYLVRPDGSNKHPVMMADAVSSIVWSKDSQWLGVSEVNSPSDERKIILLRSDTCQAYLLPALHGDLEGLFIP
jgi:hypothetical protein